MTFSWLKRMTPGADRRRAERHLQTLRVAMHLEDGRTVPLDIIERSATGFIGATSAALQPGKIVRVAFPSDKSHLLSVVRVEHGVCAFEFLSPTDFGDATVSG